MPPGGKTALHEGVPAPVKSNSGHRSNQNGEHLNGDQFFQNRFRREPGQTRAPLVAYMLDPVAFRQSVARVVGTRMKDATQGAACGDDPGKPVLRSLRNGAGVGAVQGGATDFVGGEILGGEVTATGIPGAALGGFVGGTFGAVKGVFIHWNFYK
jgi:hypothetical protein